MADDPLARFLGPPGARKLLVDSGLLVVYLIGLFDVRQLRNCRATKTFSSDDFALLVEIVRRFSAIVTTPQVITEVSNHATKLPEMVRARFMAFLGRMVVDRLSESYVESKHAVADQAFPRIGITDAAIAHAASGEALVLSADLALVDTIQRRGGEAVNFNHVREAVLLR